jgi:hypothetical protein
MLREHVAVSSTSNRSIASPQSKHFSQTHVTVSPRIILKNIYTSPLSKASIWQAMEVTKDQSVPPAGLNTTYAPLAPSQEAAYRKKCIQLKRRLAEVEANNDATRRRIDQEKQHVQKMRLMRAILLDHLKQIAETPGKSLSAEQLEELGLRADGAAHLSELVGMDVDTRPDGEGLLDDSSEESEDDPEVLPLPKKQYNYARKPTYTTPSLQNDPNAEGEPTKTSAKPS